jgi:D-lactate dehydrogenase
MKIGVFEVEEWERKAFAPLGERHEVAFSEGRLDAETVGDYADCEVVSTFIYSNLDAPVLERMPDLRLVATRSTGFDHVDVARASERGVKIANVPSYGENTVAEHVFALLLTISHRMMFALDRTRRGDFSLEGLQGFDLRGRTMGIIGTGGIGQFVARIAVGFQMDVIAFDLEPDQDLAREVGFQYVDMDDLLARSDVITLHVPGGPGTRHLLSSEEFARMKRGVVLINTARGSIVDVDALLHALADGIVSAAGLDVLPEEPAVKEEAELLRSYFARDHNLDTLLANHVLLRMRNVVITPHSAFNTREAVQRILDTTRENIEAFLAGRPVNLVND